MLITPSLEAAEAIDGSSRYLCETETAVGWTGKDDNVFSLEVTSPRTKFIIEPVDMIKTIISSGTDNGSEAKISHRVTELGDPKVEFFCVQYNTALTLAGCYDNQDGRINLSSIPFRLVTDPAADTEEGKIVFIKNRMAFASILTAVEIWKAKPFEMGFCQPF